MKYCTLLLSLLLCSFFLHGQSEDLHIPSKKNSLSFIASSQDIGTGSLPRNIPVFKLEYHRFLKKNVELRFSLGYQKQIRNVGINSFSVGLGLNKYLIRYNKLLVYAGAELSYEKFSLLPAFISSDPSIIVMSSIDNIAVVNVAALVGLEYQFNSRLSLFLEPEILQFAILEESSDIEPVLSYLRLIDGTQFGVKYRF